MVANTKEWQQIKGGSQNMVEQTERVAANINWLPLTLKGDCHNERVAANMKGGSQNKRVAGKSKEYRHKCVINDP